MRGSQIVAVLLSLIAGNALAAVLSLDLKAPPAAEAERFMGAGAGSVGIPTPEAKAPNGDTLGFDHFSLLKNGKPWIPVMGEIHYSRYPASEWRGELLKMKAGGITLVSTYVFWIHHEEEKGKFTWDGDKNLKEFVRLCGEVGLPVIVRIGPWCHGEVRNGGFPDWVEALPRKRTNDPAYLAAVKPYIEQIGMQLKGQLFKDGGPVVGIQLENEFKGPAAHLVTLKQYARDAGMDVPIYTRTAWDRATDIPTFGEVLPLWGGYAEGFWDRAITSMPGNYWEVFRFGADRAPFAAMGDPNYAAATQRGEPIGYPYLTCELGGGMMSSYHRRILINPMDAYSLALTKVGSGSNMPGYYMYHGGINPEAVTTDMLQETQSRGMWNDMPYKNYDFQAPLGEFGQVRESYNLLRELHLFLADFGPQLARMPATFPANSAAITKTDANDVRWSVRSDGEHGFIFVNNYQRGFDMPAKPDVTFDLFGGQANSTIPNNNGSATLPANTAFFWPFNLDLGGVTLESATAQPLCRVQNGDTTVTFFKATPGVEPEFVFRVGEIALVGNATVDAINGEVVNGEATNTLAGLKPGPAPAARFHTPGGKKFAIVLLDEKESAHLYKFTLAGKEYAALYDGNLVADGTRLHASLNPDMNITPPATFAFADGGPNPVTTPRNDIWSEVVFWTPPARVPASPTADIVNVKPAGPLRTIKKATTAQGVAEQPADADWENAAVYKIKLPANLPDDKETRTLLRLNYTGDVARIYLDGKLILDDFYNTEPLELGLWRYPGIASKELLVKILPLQKGAPIFLPKWPDFGNAASVVELKSAELIPQRTVTIEVK